MFNWFKRKNKPPKDPNSIEFKRWMAGRLNGKRVRYILERDASGTDTVIGKGGFISTDDQFLSVISGEKTLFSSPIDKLQAWEFMSLDGVTLTGHDLIQDKERTVMAYYKYHRE